MELVRAVCLSVAVLGASVATARAQEPGGLPEHQSLPMQPNPDGSVPPARPARIASGVISGLRLSGDNPVYPPDAKAQGIGGTVVLHAIIGKDGHVENLNVVSGNDLLAQAAVDAVKTWVYRPYLLNGEPTEVDTTVTVNFHNAVPPPDGNIGAPPVSSGQMPANDPMGAPLVRDGRRLVRISGGVLQSIRVSSVPPVYPAEARKDHIQGTVVLQVVVGKDGSIEEMNPVSGEPELTQAAIDAVKQWRYKPYLLNGEPVEVQSTVTIHFNLAG